MKLTNLSPRRRTRVGAAIVSGFALLAWTGVSSAAKAPPPKAKELSAISQYRESIPTPIGPTFPGSGPSGRAPLPARVEREVAAQGGSDAGALQRLATESRLGAPQKLLPRAPAGRTVDEQGVPRAVFSGAGEFVTDGRNGHLISLVVVMALLAAAAAAGALRRPT